MAPPPKFDAPSVIDGGQMSWTTDGHITVDYPRNPDLKSVIESPPKQNFTIRSIGTNEPKGTISSARIRNMGPILDTYKPSEPANTKPKEYTGKAGNKLGTWTRTNKQWLGLNEHERTALMALMEVDKPDDIEAAKNVSAAIVNRARQRGFDLGAHVSSRTYEPTFRSTQEKRINSLLNHPNYPKVLEWAQRYDGGLEDDPTNGSTHYLAHASAMYKLYKKSPGTYPISSWGSWSKFDKNLMDYKYKLHQDHSHAFLAPDPIGRFSVARKPDSESKKYTDRLPGATASPIAVTKPGGTPEQPYPVADKDAPIPVRTLRIDPITGEIIKDG